MTMIEETKAAPKREAPKDLMGALDFYLVQKAPFQIPPAGKEFIVQYGPWITLVLLVISLPPLLLVLGLGAALTPFGGVAYATEYTYLTIGLIAQLGLRVVALPGLFARKMSAWKLIFYAQVVGIVLSLLRGSIIGALVGGVISLYVLFQVRPLYKA